MTFSPIFQRFIEKSPISVIARGMIERVFNPGQLNQWFDATAQEQYTRELLFSSVFDIMSQVVCGHHPSVNAAYQASKEDIGVSITSVYNKLNGIEVNTSAELVRYAAGEIAPIIEKLGGSNAPLLPGLRIKLLDGNCIEKSEHRIKELRDTTAGVLPGKSLVVYDPALRLPIDVFPCEDGHAQERSLLKDVLSTVTANDVWIADRNFCTVAFTCTIASKDAFFIIREHKNYPLRLLDEAQPHGQVDTGAVYEQSVAVVDQFGDEHIFRRICIKLNQKTRNGDKEIAIITNLAPNKANTKTIAGLYRNRWTIETAFQELAAYLNSEINTLGYPRAALFGFCIALVAYMILSVIKAALGSVHGVDTVNNEVSGYYIADEISATYRGMMIAIPMSEWIVFQHISLSQLLDLIKQLALNVKLSAFRKHHRGPKKSPPKRKSNKKTPHVSTARMIANRKK